MSWREIPGWTDEHLEAIYEAAVRGAPSKTPSVFVEIGVAFGRSAGLMATLIEASGKPIRFVGVDSFQVKEWLEPEFTERIRRAGNSYSACVYELETHLTPAEQRRIELMPLASEDAARNFAATVDFCFVDGWHDEESVSRDLAAWLPKIRPGGTIAGHDHIEAHPGVELAVRKAFGPNGYEVLGSCWLRTVL